MTYASNGLHSGLMDENVQVARAKREIDRTWHGGRNPALARDMRPANWGRTMKRLRSNIAELEKLGAKIELPENFGIHPDLRP